MKVLIFGATGMIELLSFKAEQQRQDMPSNVDRKRGEQIWYFKTPWGAFMEILWRPDHLPYEQGTSNRLFNPKDSWHGQE